MPFWTVEDAGPYKGDAGRPPSVLGMASDPYNGDAGRPPSLLGMTSDPYDQM